MYSNKRQGWRKHLDFVLCDVISICLALYLAYGLRHGFSSSYASQAYLNIALVMVILDIVITLFRDSFHDVIRRGYLRELGYAVTQFSLIMIGVLIYLYFVQQTIVYSRVTMTIAWGIGILIMYLLRVLNKLRVRKQLQREERQSSVFLVCDSASLEDTVEELLGRKYRDYRLSGILLADEETADSVTAAKDPGAESAQGLYPDDEYRGIPVVRNTDSVAEYAKNHVIDEMFINLPQSSRQTAPITADALSMGIVVHQNLLGSSKSPGERVVDDFAGYMVLTSGIRLSRHTDLVIKRLMDIVGSLVGLLVTAIVFPFVAVAIRRKSPGPVIFSQIRIGKGGRRFRLYKFRSMEVGAESHKDKLTDDNIMSGYMFKVHNDPRVIPGVGDFIRRTSIDELPQFWNVLKGDMSLVGTRPPTVEEYELYDMHHLARMAIKPGITGLWQVSGRNRITDFEEVVRLDKKYIEEWSLYLDIKILIKTLQVVFAGEGE